MQASEIRQIRLASVSNAPPSGSVTPVPTSGQANDTNRLLREIAAQLAELNTKASVLAQLASYAASTMTPPMSTPPHKVTCGGGNGDR